MTVLAHGIGEGAAELWMGVLRGGQCDIVSFCVIDGNNCQSWMRGLSSEGWLCGVGRSAMSLHEPPSVVGLYGRVRVMKEDVRGWWPTSLCPNNIRFVSGSEIA